MLKKMRRAICKGWEVMTGCSIWQFGVFGVKMRGRDRRHWMEGETWVSQALSSLGEFRRRAHSSISDQLREMLELSGLSSVLMRDGGVGEKWKAGSPCLIE